MRSLMDLAEETSNNALSEKDIERLHLLLAGWQVLVNLSAADLVLRLPTDDGRFTAAVHYRPTISATVHVDDIIGLHLPVARKVEIHRYTTTDQVMKSPSAYWTGTYSMQETCAPVLHDGRIIAVVTRESNLSSPRLSPESESWTMNAANMLCQIVARGEYPYDLAPSVTAHGVPRVLNGVIVIDENGHVEHMTSNATLCPRHLGIRSNVTEKILTQEVTNIVGDETVIEESMPVVVMGRASWRTEIAAHSSTITIRTLPLVEGRKRLSAVILARDVSEVRRRKQGLMTKDTTIHEIHHRMKSNLQTVSALLRLQAHHSGQRGVKDALSEIGHRVQAIATVHAALSQDVDETVDFDEVARSVVRMSGAAASTDHLVEVVTIGSFGAIPADQAQALATVLNELVANSVEHGLVDHDRRTEVRVTCEDDSMVITVADDGFSFEPGTLMTRLGTQIVYQTVRGELSGSIEWSRHDEGGTLVTVKMQVEQD